MEEVIEVADKERGRKGERKRRNERENKWLNCEEGMDAKVRIKREI